MEEKELNRFSRRNTIKALATLPVLGYFANRFYVNYEDELSQMSLPQTIPDMIGTDVQIPAADYSVTGDKIRLGIVGNGFRGPQVLRAFGFAEQAWAEKKTNNGSPNATLRSFLKQDDLNVEITGVCDTYAPRAKEAVAIVSSPIRSGGVKQAKQPKIYSTYQAMLSDNKLDAIVIMTPDHWHAKMAIDAARAGKHVYLEKPMCQTAEEAKLLRDVVRETGVVLQVGHQNRQQASYIMAKEVVKKGLLGPISLVETYTNRNNNHGAWNRGIPEDANTSNVNWVEFLGDKPWHKFDLDRYFNWQKWFEYGTGPAGNQFTHEYDCVNQILELGIPKRVIATGGNYYFDDIRDIPDVFNAVFEYPQRGLSLTYDCTLRNSKLRDKTFLGQDAVMEINIGLAVFPDSESSKYRGRKFNSDIPLFTYHPKMDAVDAVTSATAKYYHDRGFGYTYYNGEKVDATYLHVKEWLYGIRNGKQPSCNVVKGFEETTTFYMSNLAYLEKRVVGWDSENEKII